MNNRERFTKAIHWGPIDRILTYDYLDNTNILRKYGGYDDSRKYTFEELVELNARAWKNIGVDVTRSIHDPVSGIHGCDHQ